MQVGILKAILFTPASTHAGHFTCGWTCESLADLSACVKVVGQMQTSAGGTQGGQQPGVNLIPGLQALLAQQASSAPLQYAGNLFAQEVFRIVLGMPMCYL